MRFPTLATVPLALALAACDPLTPAERQTVREWLLCEECVAGELDSVAQIGDRGVGALRKALRGPPQRGRNNIRVQAEEAYDRVPSPPIPRQEYVDEVVANYVATYQKRAAVALRRINTPSAHSALVDALRGDRGYRGDVLPVVGQAAGAVISAIEGDSQQAAVDSLVKENPRIRVSDSITGQGIWQVRVVFRVDSGGGMVSDSVQYTDPDGEAAVGWRLGPAAGVNVLRASAAGRMVRFRALGHPMGLRLVFLVQPTDVRSGQRMTPPVRIAIQDPWGATQVNLNNPAGLNVMVEGTGTRAQIPIVNGVAELSDLRFHGGGRVRIAARLINVPVAYSRPFEIR